MKAGTQVDFSDAGAGDDKLYLTGNLDEYSQSISVEGIYTLTRVVDGKTEIVKFTSGFDPDVVYFRDGHIVVQRDLPQPNGNPPLEDPVTGAFRALSYADLISPGTPLENLIAITSISDDTGQPNDFITTDKEIVLHGTSNAADGVRVEVGLGTKAQPGYQSLGFTTVTNGEWSFNQTLEIGEYNFSAYLLDHLDEVAAADTKLVKIQNSDFIIEIKAINRDSGEPDDFVTNDNASDRSFEIGGDSNAPSGTTVQIFLDNKLIGTTVVQTPGVWGFTYATLPTETIAEGDRKFTVKLVDSLNNELAADSRIVTIDTIAPNTVANVNVAFDDAGTIKRVLVDGDITDDTSIDLQGTLPNGLQSGETVRIYDGDTYLDDAIVTGKTWTFSDKRTLVDDQRVAYMARVTDKAGNENLDGNVFDLLIDTTPVTLDYLAYIDSALDNKGSKTGPLADGDITDDDTPTLNGRVTDQDGVAVTLAAGEVLVIYRNDKQVGTATVAADGSWSFEDEGLQDGEHAAYTARVENKSTGAISDNSKVFDLLIDTGNPPLPTTTVTINSISDDSGVFGNDFYTNDNDGLQIHATLSDPLGSKEVLQYSRDDGNNWINVASAYISGQTINLYDGDLKASTTIKFRVVNVSGSGDEASQAIVIDTTAPAAADVFITSITEDRGVSPTDFVTNDNQLVIRGECAADGSYIAVKLDDEVIGYAMVTGGEWSLNYLDIIPDGAHKIGADLVDLAGNVAVSAEDKPLVIDTSAKNDEHGNPDSIDGKYITVDGVTIDSGVYSNDFVTKENQLIFSGRSDAAGGSHVAVKLNDNIIGYTTIGYTTVNNSREWSFNYTATTLLDGDYTLDADLIDLAGNVAATAVDKALVIDSSATTDEHGNPDPIAGKSVTITAISDDTGVLDDDFITKDNAQDGNFVISGTSTAPINSYIEVRLGGDILGYTTVIDDQGHWSYTYTPSTPIADNDAHLFTANLVDVAGNIAAFDDQNIKVDTLAPTLISSSPTDNDEFVAPATDIVLTFSENITAGSGNIVISNANGTDVRTININAPGPDEIIIKDNTLTINLKDDLLELDSYHVTVEPGAINDIAGNSYAGITDTDVLNFSTYPAVIDLGSYGQLISPIQVDGGNWYYYFDYNKNFVADTNGADNISHDYLDGIFKYAADFVTPNSNPVGDGAVDPDTTDQYRFAALPTVSLSGKIVNLALPTLGASFTNNKFYSSTSIGNANQILGSKEVNEDYDDMLAIWDAYNGTAVTSGYNSSEAVVPNWYGDGFSDFAFSYWSATYAAEGRHAVLWWDGLTQSLNDGSSGLGRHAAAVQIINGVAPSVSEIQITADSEAVYSALNEGDVVTITVTMSEVVVVTGSPTLNLNIGGGIVQAAYQSGDRTNQLTFTYQIQAGQNDADGISIDANSIKLNGGKIRDVSGNNAILSHDAIASNPGYVVDNTAPSPSIELSDYKLGVDETATVTITFNEKVINFNSDEDVTVQNGTLEKMTSDASGKIWTGTFTPTSGIEVASNIITLAASYQDLAGNNGTAATSDNYIIDGIAPTKPGAPAIAENTNGGINATEAADGTPAGTLVVVNIGGTGAVEGDVLRINWGSQQVSYTLLQTDIDAGSATVNVPQAIIALQGDGQFDVTAQVIDQVGNASLNSVATSVMVDTVAPVAGTLSFSNLEDTGRTTDAPIVTTDKAFDLVLSGASDTNGYTVTYQQSLDGGTWTDLSLATNLSSISLSNLDDGSYQFQAVITDDAGNSSTTNTISVVVDNTKPTAGTLSFSGLEDTGSANTPPVTQDKVFDLSLTGDSDTNGYTVSYQQSLNGGIWTNLTSASLSGLDDGSYQFQAVLTDAAGNSNTTNTISVMVDNTAPNQIITIDSISVDTGVADFATSDTTLIYNGSVSSFLQEGESVQISFDNGVSWVNASTQPGMGTNWSHENSAQIITTTGTYKIQVRIIDQAGNIGDTDQKDITILSAPGFALTGEAASDYSGWSVSGAGDVNGDGLADLIVGASGSIFSSNAGRSYVVFGKADGTATNLASVADGTGGFVINGEALGDNSGLSVSSAGDVNGDGLADLIVGAIGNDASGTTNAGRSYVVFGKADNTEAVNLASLGTGGFAITGEAVDDYSGNPVSGAGDVNGDGLADLIVGTPYNDAVGQSAGRSYVVFGKADNTSINLASVANGTGGFAITGEVTNDLSGISVSGAGDVNGDGLADLIVGAYGNDANGSTAGRSYVVFGKAGNTSINLASVANGTGGFAITGEAANDESGYSVSSAGDVNGDGLADLIVGAYGNDANGPGAGRSYVVFGKADNTEAINLASVANGTGGFAITGEAGYGYSGWSVSGAGDVNGDGLADLIVGAYGNDAGGTDAGRSYVIFGKADGHEVNLADVVLGGIGLVTAFNDTTGLNSWTGTIASEIALGRDGNDTLTGGGGADVLYGGDGNDTLIVNDSNIAALSQGITDGHLARVDGGGDIDTLALEGSGVTLDLRNISNIAAGNPETGSRIASIEKIDLTGSGNNTLYIGVEDVLDMSGLNNFNSGNGWTGLASSVNRHQVVVDGNADDVVNLSGAWVDSGTQASYNGHGYQIYNATGTAAQLLVDTDITNRNIVI